MKKEERDSIIEDLDGAELVDLGVSSEKTEGDGNISGEVSARSFLPLSGF